MKMEEFACFQNVHILVASGNLQKNSTAFDIYGCIEKLCKNIETHFKDYMGTAGISGCVEGLISRTKSAGLFKEISSV